MQLKGWPLDSVYFPIYPKNFPPAAGQKSIKMFGGETPPPRKKKKRYQDTGGGLTKSSGFVVFESPLLKVLFIKSILLQVVLF